MEAVDVLCFLVSALILWLVYKIFWQDNHIPSLSERVVNEDCPSKVEVIANASPYFQSFAKAALRVDVAVGPDARPDLKYKTTVEDLEAPPAAMTFNEELVAKH